MFFRIAASFLMIASFAAAQQGDNKATPVLLSLIQQQRETTPHRGARAWTAGELAK